MTACAAYGVGYTLYVPYYAAYDTLYVDRLNRIVCHWGCLQGGTRWAETTPVSHIVTVASQNIFDP